MEPTPRSTAHPESPTSAAMARLVPSGMAPPKIFEAVARNASLFTFLVDSGLLGPTGMLDRKVLAPPLRECVVLRTCVATRCDYEFNLHVQTLAQRMGLDWAQIEDVRREQPSHDLWSPQQRAAMQLVDALVPGLTVPEATSAACREHLSEAEMIEITQLAGMYVAVAMQVALARPQLDLYRYPQPVLATSP